MNETGKPKTGFAPAEIRAFRYHAVLVAAIAAGLYVAAPSGLGRVVGVLFAVALLPIPPLVIFLWRRRRK